MQTWFLELRRDRDGKRYCLVVLTSGDRTARDAAIAQRLHDFDPRGDWRVTCVSNYQR